MESSRQRQGFDKELACQKLIATLKTADAANVCWGLLLSIRRDISRALLTETQRNERIDRYDELERQFSNAVADRILEGEITMLQLSFSLRNDCSDSRTFWIYNFRFLCYDLDKAPYCEVLNLIKSDAMQFPPHSQWRNTLLDLYFVYSRNLQIEG